MFLCLVFYICYCYSSCTNLLNEEYSNACGIDITLIDLVREPDNFLRPVFDLTCKEQKQWTNPYNGKTFIIADQFNYPITVPSSYLSSSVYIANKTTEIATMISKWTSDSHNHKLIGISSSESTSYFAYTDDVYSKQINIAVEEGIVSSWKQYVIGGSYAPKISSGLEKRIKDCVKNGNYTLNTQCWLDLFADYGTDYIVGAVWGGRFYYENVIESTLWTTMTEKYIAHEVDIGYRNKLKESGGLNGSYEVQDADFLDKTTEYIYYLGGNKQGSEWETWVQSVPNVPALLGLEITSLVNLVTDSTQANIFEDARGMYMNLQQMRNLSNICDNCRQLLQMYINNFETKTCDYTFEIQIMHDLQIQIQDIQDNHITPYIKSLIVNAHDLGVARHKMADYVLNRIDTPLVCKDIRCQIDLQMITETVCCNYGIFVF